MIYNALHDKNIDAFLSGDSVVSIYTHNQYQSYDLDFVCYDDWKKIKNVMESLGFEQNKNRHFTHSKTPYFVECPGTAVMVGDEPIKKFSKIKTSYGTLKLLTPTDCVKDRLAAFYHWNDKQGLHQAIAVSLSHPVHLSSVKRWSFNEGMVQKYEIFLKELKKKKL